MPHTIEESGIYAWDPTAADKGRDAVIKQSDHAMDAIRYLVKTLKLVKPQPNNRIQINSRVITMYLSYQDFVAAKDKGQFINQFIEFHEITGAYKEALKADKYDAQENETILQFQRVYYTLLGQKRDRIFRLTHRYALISFTN